MKGAFVICNTDGKVIHRTNAWKSPQLEGTVERIREVPCDMARGMLSYVRVKALDTACFLCRGSPSKAIGYRDSFVGSIGFLIGDSHWMRAFGFPIWVC